MFRFNPIIQRELISNLRRHRSFVLLLIYQAALMTLILIAYPRVERLDVSNSGVEAERLSNFFFLGQFAILSMITPSFTAASIAGEKERKTYEMLLASPLRPMPIIFGKLIASLTPLLLLMIGSFPIVFICLPLGGVSLEEVFAGYVSIVFAMYLFGAISITCSSVFKRTSSALAISCVLIAPIVLAFILLWLNLAPYGTTRLVLSSIVFPIVAAIIATLLLYYSSRRLLYPQDMGSMGNEVIDLEKEKTEAIGMLIQSEQFPDRLFAPPRRAQLIADGANPVYDKEIHAELFSQGTLTLRIIIQMSMLIAIPLMSVFLFIEPAWYYFYLDYILAFNALAAAVFCAGAMTSERERQTIDLLLTSPLSGWQIIGGKLLAGFRVSGVLTTFLVWPLVLGTLLTTELRRNVLTMLLAVAVLAVCSLANAVLAMFCSTFLQRTRQAMVATFIAVLLFYLAPLLLHEFTAGNSTLRTLNEWSNRLGVLSPFMAAHHLPLQFPFEESESTGEASNSLIYVLTYLAITLVSCLVGVAVMMSAVSRRWTYLHR